MKIIKSNKGSKRNLKVLGIFFKKQTFKSNHLDVFTSLKKYS